MKAINVSKFGGPEVLIYSDVDEPTPGSTEVKVRLYAAGVNPNDTYVRTGTYAFYKPELPYTPGFDGAGIIENVGSEVNDLKVGDRVFVAALLANKNTGTYAQKVVCDATAVHKIPDSISFSEGAALGIPALTAYRALFHRAKIKSDDFVLIHGASGGVGTLAVQMAKSHGATVAGTASTDVGKKLIKNLGADFAFDHLNDDNIDEFLELTGGKYPDVIIEFLSNINLETDLKIVNKYGRIVIIGSRGTIEISPRLSMAKEADIYGMAILNASPEEYQESIVEVGKMLASGTLKPAIGRELSLEDAKIAHELILDKSSSGKWVLKID